MHCCVLLTFDIKKVEGMAYNMNDEVKTKLFKNMMMIVTRAMVMHVIAD